MTKRFKTRVFTDEKAILNDLAIQLNVKRVHILCIIIKFHSFIGLSGQRINVNTFTTDYY